MLKIYLIVFSNKFYVHSVNHICNKFLLNNDNTNEINSFNAEFERSYFFAHIMMLK